MVRLTYKKRVWVVREFLKWGDYERVASAQGIHWRTVYKLLAKHNEYGWEIVST
jgi:hypothetical protein